MGAVISVLNEKGGVSKTSTVVELASLFAKSGKSVVVIDLDGQANASTLLLGEMPSRPTVADLFFKTEGFSVISAIRQSLPAWGDIAVLPSDSRMSKADREIAGKLRAESILRHSLKEIVAATDVTLIDLPPALNLVTINAMVLSSHYLIPTDVGEFAIGGVRQVMGLIKEMQEVELCQNLASLGVLVTQYQKGNANFTRQFLAELEGVVPENLLKEERIPHSTKIKDAHAKREPVTTFDAENAVSIAYRNVCNIIAGRIFDGTN